MENETIKHIFQIVVSYEIVFSLLVIILLFLEYKKYKKHPFIQDAVFNPKGENLKIYPFWRYCLGCSKVCYNDRWVNSPFAAIFRVYLTQLFILLFAIVILFTKYLIF